MNISPTKAHPLRARIAAAATVTGIAALVTFGAASPAFAAAPVAAADYYAVAMGIPLNVSAPSGILANDSDADGDALVLASLTYPAGGAIGIEYIQLNQDGSFTYAPPPGYTGTRTFQYQVGDGAEVSPLTDIVFTISGPPAGTNSAPLPVADAFATNAVGVAEVSAPGILVNDLDPDGDPLTVVSHVLVGASLPGEQLDIQPDGYFYYHAPTNFTGVRVWEYVANDGTVDSAPVTITFTISQAVPPAANTAPVAVVDVYPVTQDVVLSAGAPGVLANDSDGDGDAITVVAPMDPVGGSLPGEGLSLDSDGSFHYVPPTGFVGTRWWRYTATDGTDASLEAEIVFTITAAGANTPPVANPDSYAVVKNVQVVHAAPGLLVDDTDADGDALQVASGTAPAGGLLPGENMSGTYDGSFTYTPPTDFVGTRVFTYTVSDGTEVSAPTTITFTISAAGGTGNTAPVAVADSYVVVKDVLFARSAPGTLVNDSDADGDAIAMEGWISPAGGLLPGEFLSGKIDGSFAYTPPTGFVGDRVFTYTIFDGTAVSAEATITFTVQPREGQPGDPLIPNDPTVPTLASTGSTPSWMLGVLAAMVAATGFVLVRSSRRVA